ncbi:MAG: hypothetical protein HYY96_15060 [Candidatus Tectomicrobia bacterium]|nr:hypothetical protein [Candidatus Tectomicrobia bacterium]
MASRAARPLATRWERRLRSVSTWIALLLALGVGQSAALALLLERAPGGGGDWRQVGNASEGVGPLGATPSLAQQRQRPFPDVYYHADKVIRFRLGAGSLALFNEKGEPTRVHNDPQQALGPPDHGLQGWPYTGAVSLGNGGEIILGFPTCIEDGEGDDFIVHEIVTPERAEVFGSLTPEPRDFRLLGTASGTTRFDLAAAGVQRVYLIRIVDQNDVRTPSPFAGFDVDAVEVIHPCQPFTS